MNINELEALAKAATQGPWDMVENSHLAFGGVQLHWINSEAGNLAENICKEEAAYIAAANPEAVLALIALVREMGKALGDMTRTCPKEAGCNDFHHFAGQRHSFDEDCPPTQAYFAAMARADTALTKYKEMTNGN